MSTTSIPSDISILISKCSSKEQQINTLETKLLQLKIESNSTITSLQNKISKLEEENSTKDNRINDLTQTIQFLEIDNQQHSFLVKHIESQLFIKSLQVDSLKQELSQVKKELKQTLERNNNYIQKLSTIEQDYSDQINKIKILTQTYKSKLKLLNRNKIN
jgi:chromosome segregation ATPase